MSAIEVAEVVKVVDAAEAKRTTANLVVVTGAASGLGAALTRQLLAQGHTVLGVDRDVVLLEALTKSAGSGVNFIPLVCDLAMPQGVDQAVQAVQAAQAVAGVVELLIHSAGTSAVGPFLTQAAQNLYNVLTVNLYAPIQLTTALQASGALASNASVVLVSSLSHYLGYPGAAVYAASKDGLAAYGRSLSVALRVRGGNCLTVFPGPMRTPHAARFAPSGSSDRGRIAPEVVARALLAAVAARKSRLVVGLPSQLARLLGVVAPGVATRIMAATLWRKLR